MAHAIGDRVRVTPAAESAPATGAPASPGLVGTEGTVSGYDPGAERLRYRVQLDGRRTPLWFAEEEIEPAAEPAQGRAA